MRASKNRTHGSLLTREAQKITAKARFDSIDAEAQEKASEIEDYRKISPFILEAERARDAAKRKIQKEINSMRWSSLFYRQRTMPLICALKAIDVYHGHFSLLMARDEFNKRRLKQLIDEKDRLLQILDAPE